MEEELLFNCYKGESCLLDDGIDGTRARESPQLALVDNIKVYEINALSA